MESRGVQTATFQLNWTGVLKRNVAAGLLEGASLQLWVLLYSQVHVHRAPGHEQVCGASACQLDIEC